MIIASNYRLNQLLHELQIKLSQQIIKRVRKAKLFGVTVDEKLSWADHINDILFVPKVLKGLQMLRALRPMLSSPQIVSLYNTIVLPQFDYCSTYGAILGTKSKSWKTGLATKSDLRIYYRSLTGLTFKREGI